MLFVTTLGFIVRSLIHLNFLSKDLKTDFSFTIHCQASVLVWILISFINYYLFYFLSYLILKMSADSPKVRTKRFKVAIWMSLLVVPFMVSWNMYGNMMIH